MESATRSTAQLPAGVEARARLLVVDDESISREILARMLRRHGYDVETAGDGQAALAAIAAQCPELVLLDLIMPDMDGLTCLQAIREQHSSIDLPVIMITAEGQRETIVGAFRSGANDYLTKPVDPEVMLARVTTQLQFRQAQAVQRSEERFALAVKGSKAGIWDWDVRRGLIYFSPRWKQMLGYGETELEGGSDEWFRRIHPDDVVTLCATIMSQGTAGEAQFECELRMRHREGNYRWMLCTGIVQRDADGAIRRLAGSLTDVTEGKVRDALTGLPNRVLFRDALEQAAQRVRKPADGLFAVLFLDLDKFKLVNDSLGHHEGDRLLLQVAGRLNSCLRSRDRVAFADPTSTVARHGGDEFTVLLDGLRSPADAQRVADRIIATLSEPYSLGGHEVCIGVSVGVAIGGLEAKSPDDLLREADTAMYCAKSDGRGCNRMFDPDMQSRAAARLTLEKDLRQAVKAEDFFLHYQPIVRLSTGRIEGLEALVRWRHPPDKRTGPQQFIPVLEELGLIGVLGHWVFREACRQATVWRRELPDLPRFTVSVNCSARELLQPHFKDQLQVALEELGTDPTVVKIELTESTLMTNPDAVGPLLNELRRLGIGIAIDDFGTGYSSLAYLHRLPLDVLKIDRSFVAGMTTSNETLEIVRTILTLGRSLNLDVVAEGVETAEQVQLLQELGCTHGQGYLFSRPVSAADAAQLMVANLRQPTDAGTWPATAWQEELCGRGRFAD